MMQLIIHISHASLIPCISLDQYLIPNLYTIPNMQNMRSFAVQYMNLAQLTFSVFSVTFKPACSVTEAIVSLVQLSKFAESE